MSSSEAKKQLYRLGYVSKKLKQSDYDIMYGQLGGGPCVPTFTKEDFPAIYQQLNDKTTKLFQDLTCKICGKRLDMIAQFASYGETTPNIHRVIYVYVCNSMHFPKPGSYRCLVLNHPYNPEPANNSNNTITENTIQQNQFGFGAKKNDWINGNNNGALSFMSNLKTTSEVQIQNQPSKIKFNTRKASFVGYDICSEENEEAVIEAMGTETEEALINEAMVNELKNQKKMNNDMTRLSVPKMSQKQFVEAARVANLPKAVKDSMLAKNNNNNNKTDENENSTDSENNENNENEENNTTEEEDETLFVKMHPVNMLQRQEKGDFAFIVGYDREPVTRDELLIEAIRKYNANCKETDKKLPDIESIKKNYVHEFDLLSSIISHLEMDKKANFYNAEFESIHLWSPKEADFGWSEGVMVVIEEEGIDELNKLLPEEKNIQNPDKE